VIDVELNETFGPEGEVDPDRAREPEKPFKLVSVMVDVPDEPCWNESEVGFAAIEKPGVDAAWITKFPAMEG